MGPKQQAFVEAYLATGGEDNWNARWNATRAADAAGYKHPRQAGSRLLSNVDIQAAIKARLDEMKMGADEVLVGLAEQARFDPLRFMTAAENPEGGQWVYIDLAAIKAAGLGQVVKKISYDKNERLVVEFHDAQRARQLIGQHHKLFTQRHELDMPELAPLPELLSQLIDKVYGDGGDH
jgi:hypothetical protein